MIKWKRCPVCFGRDSKCTTCLGEGTVPEHTTMTDGVGGRGNQASYTKRGESRRGK